MKKKSTSDLASNSKTISEFSEKYIQRISRIFSDINKQKIIELEKLINQWSPYNTIACLLLWESIENQVFFNKS